MPCPPEVLALIERFNEQREDYQNPAYLETQLRIEFIDPLLKILGWDVENKQGFAEAYKEVIHEYSLKTKDATKAPDYCFRIGPARKFFLEAKKPAENIKEDKKHAYQLRRYAWSANLPLSILTDFQEWAVYDTNIKPEEKDKASVARVMFFTCDELAEKWDEFAAIFSKQAIQRGSFDKYAASNKKKRGTGRVDAEFLAEIERWRDTLAHNIALRNDGLSQRDLNFSVQRIIDRIIFLRIAEDRGIEDYGRLQALVNGPAIYPRLMQLFRAADDRYNSGIFHFEKEKGRSENPDSVTPDLAVDDKVLRDILECLYFPKSPYEFSVLPADILGQVYEQFLGKVITLTPGHRAKVDEKPEVKKAGGVYYTPTYIVDYIVKQTVGKLLDKKTPKQAAKLTILDPACGSGSFLIGAYQFLLDWHLQWYINDGPEKHRKEIYLGAKGRGRESLAKKNEPSGKTTLAKDGGPPRADQPGNGDWRLTSAERKRILLNNIYGVDIDEQAVEVTKLSLLLKVLEGENRETLDRQLRLVEKHRALPDLGSNIKCGNSLIGHDFYAGKQLDMFGEEERLRINTFEWKDEFPAIMKSGGFDAVIGNPPYVRSINLKKSNPTLWQAYRERYETSASREWDIYLLFVEKGLGLLGPSGRLGFILPNKFVNSEVGENLREIICRGSHLEYLVHFGAFQVFAGVTTYTCLLFLGSAPNTTCHVVRYRGDVKKISAKCLLPEEATAPWKFLEFAANKLSRDPWQLTENGKSLLNKNKNVYPLEELAEVYQGTGTRADKVFVVEERKSKGNLTTIFSFETQKEYVIESALLKPLLRGRSIDRYCIAEHSLRLIVPYDLSGPKPTLITPGDMSKMVPKTLAYLRESKALLEDREDGRFQGSEWYCYGRPQNMHRFSAKEKIVMPDVAARGTCTLDTSSNWLIDTAYGLVMKRDAPVDLRFVLAILNSPFLTYYLRETGTPLRGGYFRMKTAYLNRMPIPRLTLENPRDKNRHDKVISLADQSLALREQLSSAKTDLAKAALERQITATDRQIDELVYELYELTPEEIKIVEEATV